jgi:hypothetical protein
MNFDSQKKKTSGYLRMNAAVIWSLLSPYEFLPPGPKKCKNVFRRPISTKKRYAGGAKSQNRFFLIAGRTKSKFWYASPLNTFPMRFHFRSFEEKFGFMGGRRRAAPAAGAQQARSACRRRASSGFQEHFCDLAPPAYTKMKNRWT